MFHQVCIIQNLPVKKKPFQLSAKHENKDYWKQYGGIHRSLLNKHFGFIEQTVSITAG